ncbi:MAG: hypothetical protein QXZ20_02480, partial [Candidatus Aenigmatarchaeota archaeon]
MKKFLFFIFFFFSLLAYSYPNKIYIIYTGNSYSTLYPCGSCPASIGGGITRRATVIKEIVRDLKNVIILDSGNFIAGGNFDFKSINPNLDKKRSSIYCNAMQIIGYEFVGIGEAEFNFGVDFLKERIKKSSYKFISANIELKGILPYYIKTFNFPNGGNFKVAITGLTPYSVYKKFGIKVKNYKETLERIIKELENKVDLFILISTIGDEETIGLLQNFQQIKFAFSSGQMHSSYFYEVFKNSVLFRPSFEAKDIRIVEIEIDKNKNIQWKADYKKLSLDIKEEPRVKKIIPTCFRNEDCAKREGFLATCENPAELSSICNYLLKKPIEITVITDKNCNICSTQVSQEFLKNYLDVVQFKMLHYEDQEAKNLIKKYSINTLPCFIFPKDIKNEQNFSKIYQLLEEKDEVFISKDELSGVFCFLNQEKIPKQIDLFLYLYSPEAKKILNKFLEISKKNGFNLNIYFSLSDTKYLKDEIKIALAVKKLYPDRFFSYLSNRLKNINSIHWFDSLEKDMDYIKIKEFTSSKEIE